MPDIDLQTIIIPRFAEEVASLLLEATGFALCARSMGPGLFASQSLPVLSDARPLVQRAQTLIEACEIMQQRRDEEDARTQGDRAEEPPGDGAEFIDLGFCSVVGG